MISVAHEGSGLFSESEAMRMLGCDKGGLTKLIKQKWLRRHPVSGSFLAVQVIEAANRIARELYNESNGTEMGSGQQTVGVLNGFRHKPDLV